MQRRDDFLRKGLVVRLATAEDAGPHIVPVWYMYENGRFYIGTNSKTRKARNVRRNANVGFCVDKGVNAPDIYGVAGQGRARLIEDSGVKEIGKRIILRYFDGMTKSAQELLDDTDCIIEVTPVRMWKWQY